MWERELAEKLQKADTPSARREIIKAYQKTTGLCESTLYRRARANGFSSGRQKRTDAGKCTMNKHQIQFLHSLLMTTSRENKGAHMPMNEALRIAENNGVIEKGSVSVSTLNRILKDRQMDKKTMGTAKPAVQMRSLHPNHVHVVDSSVCIQYYLKDGQIGLRDEKSLYKNKIENFKQIKQRLLRYVLVDHYSGAIYVKYYYSSGETQADLFDFLISAWEEKSGKLPFRGVPAQLLRDHGSANMSKTIMGWLKRLNVETPKSTPYQSQIQGAVERMHNFVEGSFESGLRLQPAHSLEDINTWVTDWCISINSERIHRRTKQSRNSLWMTIKPEQLINLPERKLLQDLFREPEVPRTVDAHYAIPFRTLDYDLRMIPGIIPRKSKVQVVLRVFDWPKIGVVFNDQEYIVEPIAKNEAGFREDAPIIGQEYKALPESDLQKQEAISENLAYGDNRKKGDLPFGGSLTVMGNRSEDVPEYISKHGTAHELAKIETLEDKRIPIIDVLDRISKKLGSIPKGMNQELRDKYGSSVSLKEAEKIVWEITEGGDTDAGTTETMSS
ncbi:MAG: hypothetical protein AB7E76_02695 [Deferribacterales bacterium]